MNHAAFIADYVKANTPQPGTRARRGAMTVEVATAKAEALWAIESLPENVTARALEAKGGKFWKSEAGARRVYLNALEFSGELKTTVYFDINANTWHDQRGNLLTADALAAVLKIAGV